MICQNCGKDAGQGNYCQACGAPLQKYQQNEAQPTQIFQTQEQPQFNQQANAEKPKGIASLVLGIISIVVGLLTPIGGIACSIVGIIIGAVDKSKGADGKSTVGIVLSIIGILVSVVNWIITFSLYMEIM